MAFRFPLETLLRFRQSVERQEEMQLQAVNQNLRNLNAEIESFEQSENNRCAARKESLTAGLSGAELHFELCCDAMAEHRRGALQKERARQEKLRDQQYEKFRQARIQREVLESVRETQLRSYQKEQARREQRSLDDLFLMRREFVRRG